MVEYDALTEEARRSGVKILFDDEAHFRADAELRGKWVLRGEPALVDSTRPRCLTSTNFAGALPQNRVISENWEPTAWRKA